MKTQFQVEDYVTAKWFDWPTVGVVAHVGEPSLVAREKYGDVPLSDDGVEVDWMLPIEWRQQGRCHYHIYGMGLRILSEAEVTLLMLTGEMELCAAR